MSEITHQIYTLFLFLSGICAGLQFLTRHTRSEISSGNNPQFLKFQRTFLLVYFLALFSDWLQGPYVYKLYSSYGFTESQIAVLYVVGFASSVIFGTGTGTLADRFGRRRMCIAFCVVYTICCLTKVSPDFNILLIGRICGGIATSMLFSSFESWYVYEHLEHFDFPSEWLQVTFSKAAFWNGILAIVAGIVANVTTDFFHMGPVSPFLMAVPVLVLCLLIITSNWEENFGNRNMKCSKSCIEGLRHILFDEQILLLGVMQSLFESVMYMFVFMWTPILDAIHPPLGIVFACFMVSTMIGAAIYKLLLSKSFTSKSVLGISITLSLISMFICYITTDSNYKSVEVSLFAFLLIEVAVGMYFPAVSVIRSKIIPESHRASIMNWFRVPMNIITCVGLLLLHNEEFKNGNHYIFGVCTLLMISASLAHWRFSAVYKDDNESDDICA